MTGSVAETTGAGGTPAAAGAGAGTTGDPPSSCTLTRHLLQYRSPGLIGFPHARHVRIFPASEGVTAGAGGTGAGATGGIPAAAGAGAGTTGDPPSSCTLTRHLLQYRSPGLIGLPHARHVLTPPVTEDESEGTERSGAGGGGAGTADGTGAGAGAGGTGCVTADGTVFSISSASEAPQLRQNLALAPTGFPHSGQNGTKIHI